MTTHKKQRPVTTLDRNNAAKKAGSSNVSLFLPTMVIIFCSVENSRTKHVTATPFFKFYFKIKLFGFSWTSISTQDT
jgi:hypothetical protein